MDLVLARVLDHLKLYFLFVLMAMSLVGMDSAGWLGGLKGVVGMAVVQSQNYTDDLVGILAEPLVAIRDYKNMKRELHLAQERLKASYVLSAEVEQLRSENQDLKQLSGVEISANQGVRLVANMLTAGDGVFLNKGGRDSILEGMVVVDTGGLLVGRVVEVNPYMSRVMLLTDRDSVVGVRVLGKVTSGVLAGDGFRGILREVLQTDSLEVDDVLVTSGSEGMFPDGLVVGEVEITEGLESDVTKGAVVRLRDDIPDTVIVLK